MLNDKTLALLGDRDAAERLTEAGVLLPCPFCGGEAMIEYDTINPFEYCVFCLDCGVMPATGDDVKVVKGRWNRRAHILTPTQLALLQIAEEPRVFEEENSDG